MFALTDHGCFVWGICIKMFFLYNHQLIRAKATLGMLKVLYPCRCLSPLVIPILIYNGAELNNNI